MDYTIHGSIAQHVTLQFNQGESAWVSNGGLIAYRDLDWRLRVPGGLGGALSRSLSGEGVSLTYVEPSAPGAYALVAANAPGHVIAWDLADGPVITTRGAFLAAWGDIDISVTVARRAGAAFFGGVGLFLQRISGQGTVLVHGSGDLVEHTLRSGETMRVSTGNLAAFADSVDYSIEAVGSVGKFFFGGEGLFMTRVSGPGRVLLQSLKRTATQRSSSAS